MCRSGPLGLILQGEPSPLVSPRVDGPLLKLVTAAFLRAAEQERSASPVRVAPLMLARIRTVLGRLERAGRIPRRALRLALEEAR